MTNKKIITTILSITIIHFLITSVMAFYIGYQIGSQVGQITAKGLQDASGKIQDNSSEDATSIYKKMKDESDEITARWKIPLFLIALPAKPIMNPILNKFGERQLNRLTLNEITRDQFRTRLIITHYTANFLNSLSFAFLVYVTLRILNHYKNIR